MKAEQLRAESVGVDVGGRVLLNDVNLRVASGEMLVITGASGSGKTTLARTLAGVTEPDRGEVTLAGTSLRELRAFSQRPAFVPQNLGLLSVLTARETIGLPLQAHSFARKEIRERSSYWLSAFGLENCANRSVEELSGGQRQRVAIARALIKSADVIVMDEPTSELDSANRALVLSILVGELARGAVLAVVSHEEDVIARADFVYEVPTCP